MPEFITLVNSESLEQARHISGNKSLRKLQKAYVDSVALILERGEAAGISSPSIDPTQRCITIAAIGFYYLTNRHTGSAIFGSSFMTKGALADRLAFSLETIRRLVLSPPRELVPVWLPVEDTSPSRRLSKDQLRLGQVTLTWSCRIFDAGQKQVCGLFAEVTRPDVNRAERGVRMCSVQHIVKPHQ